MEIVVIVLVVWVGGLSAWLVMLAKGMRRLEWGLKTMADLVYPQRPEGGTDAG